MEMLLMIVSVLLITIVLLQSGKAEGASLNLGGGSSDLFSNRKERGVELFISRCTLVLGLTFFLVSLIMEFM